MDRDTLTRTITHTNPAVPLSGHRLTDTCRLLYGEHTTRYHMLVISVHCSIMMQLILANTCLYSKCINNYPHSCVNSIAIIPPHTYIHTDSVTVFHTSPVLLSAETSHIQRHRQFHGNMTGGLNQQLSNIARLCCHIELLLPVHLCEPHSHTQR